VRVVRGYQENLPEIPVDEKFCEQVFVNLAQNAYEAMGEKGGDLQISLTLAQHNGRQGIEAAIADTGPGISADLRDHIFNPFVTTKKAGVGLGLSIVSKIVDEHHGSIELAAGAPGARFVIFFPFSEKGAAPVLYPESTLAERRASPERSRRAR